MPWCDDCYNCAYDDDNSTLVPVTRLCPGTIANSVANAYIMEPPSADEASDFYPFSLTHGISMDFRDLQVTGVPNLNIPLFHIDITTRRNIPLNPITLGNLISAAYTSALNFYQGQAGVTANQFLTTWSDFFNTANYRQFNTTSTSNFHMGSVGIPVSQTDPNNNNATVVANCP